MPVLPAEILRLRHSRGHSARELSHLEVLQKNTEKRRKSGPGPLWILAIREGFCYNVRVRARVEPWALFPPGADL